VKEENEKQLTRAYARRTRTEVLHR